jgi:hypothetical protein
MHAQQCFMSGKTLQVRQFWRQHNRQETLAVAAAMGDAIFETVFGNPNYNSAKLTVSSSAVRLI